MSNLEETKRVVKKGIEKMEREQKRDPCCVWFEIETALYQSMDFLNSLPPEPKA